MGEGAVLTEKPDWCCWFWDFSTNATQFAFIMVASLQLSGPGAASLSALLTAHVFKQLSNFIFTHLYTLHSAVSVGIRVHECSLNILLSLYNVHIQ